MKFYIISFVLHVIIIASAFHFTAPEIVDNKNIVVYLNELNSQAIVEDKKSISEVNNETLIKKEEKKQEIKKVEKKKIEKKKIEKKKININKKAIKSEIKEENTEENSKESSKNNTNKNDAVNYFSGMEKDGNGGYIGDSKGMSGFGYKIIREVDPNYPIIAKKMGYKKEVIIKTKFLVGLDGKVEKVEFLDDFNNYGFHNEVEKALYKWEFSPIIYHGKKIKMYFYKDFRFNVKG